MSRTHELISAIYAATLPPKDFNRRFDDLDALLFDDAGAEDGFAPLEPTTHDHIEIARSIQDRIGRAKSREQQLDIIIGAIPNPAYLLTRKGEVAATNTLAANRHARKPLTLDDCLADDAGRQQVLDFIARSKSERLLAVVGHANGGTGQTSVLVKRVAADLLPGETGQLFLLSIVDLGFDDSAVALFREAFELTDAETQVAVLAASGLRLADIAAERDVAIDTVRTQVKTIKNKTGVRDMSALVRLMYGFNAGALASASPGSEGRGGGAIGPSRPRRQITLPDGRRLEYVEQGASSGEVVLLFHNLPYGVELPQAAVAEVQRRGVRVIAPFRPGFGHSDGVNARGDDLLTQVAQDSAELLRQLDVRQVAVLSHATSAPFALRFARLHPRMVTRLVGVSRPPAWRDEWMAQTPQRQRFMLRLTRYTPHLLPVVAWAMVACMESSYASEFVVYNCKDGAADARAVEDSETVDFIAKGSVEALRHGLDGFCRECELALGDFTAEARTSEHKFVLLHGGDDRIVAPAQSLTFARDVPGTRVEIVEGAGQLLFYSHWRRVLDAVAPERTHDAIADVAVVPGRRAAAGTTSRLGIGR